MFVRVARFEGGTAAGMTEQADRLREELAHLDQLPPPIRAVKHVLMLVDPDAGVSLDLVFCESMDDLRAVDAVLNEASPASAGSGRRSSVQVFEVALDAPLD